ncbi:MAG: HAMP domain-containing histidine kinase [Nitrospirae bacterium YQR-1]
MKISNKLLLIFSFKIIVFGIMGYLLVAENNVITREIEDLRKSDLSRMTEVTDILSSLSDSRRLLTVFTTDSLIQTRTVSISDLKASLSQVLSKRNDCLNKWLEGISIAGEMDKKTGLRNHYKRDSLEKDFIEVKSRLNELAVRENSFIDVYNTKGITEAVYYFDNNLRPYSVDIQNYLIEQKRIIFSESEHQMDIMIKNNDLYTVYVIIAFLIVVAVTVSTGLYLRRQILAPVNRLKAQTYEIGKNRLNAIIEVTSKDEIGELTESFNEMVVELKNHRENLDDLLDKRTNDLIASHEKLRLSQKQLVQSEKMAALAQLVAGIAHEINTPVGVGVTAASHFDTITKNILNSYAEKTMTKTDLEEYFDSARESTDLILKNLYRTADLVRSFKMVSADQTSQELRKFKIKPYIEDVLLSLKPKLKKTAHKINVQCDDKIELYSYPGAYAQIITNLIVNSLTHAYDDGEAGNIKIAVFSDDTNVTLEYTDDGKGIPRENINYIFEPFFTTNRKQGGTGLGLHVLYNIVTQSLKGTIVCQSTTAKGVKFIITAPNDAGGVSNG